MKRVPRWGWLFAPLAVSCGAHFYRPTSPHVADDPEIRAEVTGVHLSKAFPPKIAELGGIGVEVSTTGRPGAAVGAAMLNAPSNRPCQDGVPARADTAARSALAESAQQLWFQFASAQAGRARLFTVNDVVLDLPVFPADRTRPRRCLRVPVRTSIASMASTEWRSTPGLMAGTLRVAALGALPNYGGTAVLFGYGLGGWLGPWRLVAMFEGALVGQRGVTPIPPERKPFVGALGGAAELDRLLLEGGGFGVQLQLGYDILGTVAPNADSSPAAAAGYHPTVLHGPRIALRLQRFFGPDRVTGFQAPPDAFAFGLAAFGGLWWQGFERLAPAPIVGGSLEGNFAM